jgi:hypothetical protein
MSKTIDINPKSNIKQQSMGDIPAYAGQPVISRYEADSTASQTLINFGFNLNTANKDAFLLYVDGKLLREGASNDFTFTAVDAGGNTSQALLNSPIPAGLNIIAIKLGTKKEQEGLIDGRLTELYEFSRDGFQGFVVPPLMTATATTGAPAAGVFHSNIVNRAPMPDLRNDLGVRFGVERIHTNSIVLVPNEFGPNLEQVFRAVNDTQNRIRFVGQWQVTNDASGNRVDGFLSAANDQSSYIEVVFYGTGLNWLCAPTGLASGDVRVSVDGGAEGSNIHLGDATGSPLYPRNYNPNQILNVASGLTLGVHTVRIRKNHTTAQFMNTWGFEILNQNATATNLSVAPGVAYANGRKITDLSQSLIANNAVATGTRGGRVVTFVRADGTVGQSWQAVDASQLNLTAANHVNEEVARVYGPREFGAGRADDFSLKALGAGIAMAFTLEDGTTTLTHTNGNITNAGGVQPEGIVFGAAAATFRFVFVGTGLDVTRYEEQTGTGGAVTVVVDGTSLGTFDTTHVAGRNRILKVVSGLPYGTHNVTFTYAAGAAGSGFYRNFIVYQPKKPSIPAGAVELADYNVMANFSYNATANINNISTGVLRKSNVREMVTVNGTGGTTNWNLGAINATNVQNISEGTQINTDRGGAYIQYTFFGTGFDFRSYRDTNRSSNISVTLNGTAATAANFPTATFGQTGFTYNSGTAVLSQNGAALAGSGFAISGLPLALYTVRLTNNTAGQIISADSFDIITPIHAAGSSIPTDLQNSLPIGSLALADTRKTSAIKEVTVQEKNVSQAFGVTGTPTTTATSLVPCPDMYVSHLSKTGKIRISYSASHLHSLINGFGFHTVFVNGAIVGNSKFGQAYSGNAHFNVADSFTVDVPKDQISSVALYWQTTSGTLSNSGASRNITVEDV